MAVCVRMDATLQSSFIRRCCPPETNVRFARSNRSSQSSAYCVSRSLFERRITNTFCRSIVHCDVYLIRPFSLRVQVIYMYMYVSDDDLIGQRWYHQRSRHSDNTRSDDMMT